MYRIKPNLYIGFHGCDESIGKKLVSLPDSVIKSNEKYDWLGNGFYVWENNYQRALDWATEKHERGDIETPYVVGVVYQLDHCLDLTDSEFIGIISRYYDFLKEDLQIAGKALPKNKDLSNDKHHDLIIRELDCAVIEYLHQKISEQIIADNESKGFSDLLHFDSVRGVFTEGGQAFEGAGIQKKTHIQICIRNLNCIKGFFIPRNKVQFP